jgi:hypothetical protein
MVESDIGRPSGAAVSRRAGRSTSRTHRKRLQNAHHDEPQIAQCDVRRYRDGRGGMIGDKWDEVAGRHKSVTARIFQILENDPKRLNVRLAVTSRAVVARNGAC